MESSNGYVTALPAPALRSYVDKYVGYRLSGFSAGVHRGLPSKHMTFIASIGSPIDVIEQTDARQAPQMYRCVLGGLQARPALIAHDGDMEGVEIELTPLGTRALFGMPARELWDLSIECADVSSVAEELVGRLHEAASWAGRFAACDMVLLRLLDTEQVAVPEIEYAWRTLVRSGGTATVVAIATEVGWSRQHLSRRFGDEFGLGPKLAGRVLRFERACQLLCAYGPHRTIAEVAAACGYYDQAHMNRDFADLAGCAPSVLAGEEVPHFQDDALAIESCSVP